MSDISIIDIDPSTGRVSFKVTHKAISGIQKLVQVVVLSLLNSPGKDVLDPAKGSGIPSMIGMNFDASDTQELTAEIVQRVKKTQREVQLDQIGLQLSSEERLRDIQIISVKQGNSVDELLITLRIINEAGRIAQVTV